MAAASDCGKPAIYVEAPGEGRTRPADVARNVRAARQLLRLMRLVDEPLEPLKPEIFVEDSQSNAGYLQVQIVPRHGGFFQPCVTLGDLVQAGQPWGHILDTVGRTVETILAPCAGRAVFLRTFPVVNPGDSLGTVMEIR